MSDSKSCETTPQSQPQRKTRLVNIIGSPGAGKTVSCALTFAELKILSKYTTEYIAEFAKNLVWQEQFFALDNQIYVSNKQYLLFKSLVGKVDIIVTDGSLLHGLYYNLYNPNNLCNPDKTEQFILEKYAEFNNINIFLERGDFPYEEAGRQQDETEAKLIDNRMKEIFRKYQIPFHVVKIQGKDVSPIIEIINSYMKDQK